MGAESALEAGVQDGAGAEIGGQLESSPDALHKAAGWTSLGIHPLPLAGGYSGTLDPRGWRREKGRSRNWELRKNLHTKRPPAPSHADSSNTDRQSGRSDLVQRPNGRLPAKDHQALEESLWLLRESIPQTKTLYCEVPSGGLTSFFPTHHLLFREGPPGRPGQCLSGVSGSPESCPSIPHPPHTLMLQRDVPLATPPHLEGALTPRNEANWIPPVGCCQILDNWLSGKKKPQFAGVCWFPTWLPT